MIEKSLVSDPNCEGIEFTITNKSHLAKAIALILIQERSLAKAIITNGTASIQDEIDDFPYEQADVDDIIAKRLNVIGADDKISEKLKEHRDGLLFQHMMWLAAHLDTNDGDIIAPPHVQRADKGQDLFIVHTAENDVDSISICEDKATINPRETIRDLVWPEIREYESGQRRDEIRSSTIALLSSKQLTEAEATRIVRNISWNGKRKYRVRVTIEDGRTNILFKGFPEIVSGDIAMRRGETVLLPQMRIWMDDLAQSIINELQKLIGH